MKPRDESFQILERILRACPADEADANLVATDRTITRFANSSVHQNMAERSAGVTIRAVVDHRIGVASTSSMDADDLEKTAKLAADLARKSEPLEKFDGLYRGGDPLPDTASFDQATADLPPADKAHALLRMFDEGRIQNVIFAGAYTTGSASLAVANTHGVQRYAQLTNADAVVIAMGREHSGYATGCSRRNSSLDVEALGREATEKATLLAETSDSIAAGPYDVILEPAALAEAFEWMTMIAFSGRSYEDGSSFFVDKLGQQVLGTDVTITDDALDPDFMPFPFDMEGMAKRRLALIERGVPKTPALDKMMSDRLGMTATASAGGLGSDDHGSPLHLSLSGGDATREELIRSTKLGIWVTRFNYVNGLLEPKSALMTGMTRDGTFLIRDGEVVARLPNLRWTQSMVEALNRVDGMTRDRRIVSTWWNFIGGTIAPTIRVRGWNITGVQGAEGE